MYKNERDISSNLTRRNRIMYYCHRLLDIVSNKINCQERIFLTFVCVKSPRYSFATYWKIFISENDMVLDVSREISIILDIESYNNEVLKTESYGVCIQDDICRSLSKAFYRVFGYEVDFSYNYFDGSVD